MKNDTVVVRNTVTGEIGEVRRRLFESSVFNPNGLLVETEDTRGGCVDCGTASFSAETPDPVIELDDDLEYDSLEEEED